MSAAARAQVIRWQEEGSGPKAIGEAMTETTFEVITATMLRGMERAEMSAVRHASERYLSRVSWEVAFAAVGLPEWLPHPGSLRMRTAARSLRSAVGRLILRRRQQGKEMATGGDLLGRLLDARDPVTGEPMQDEQLIDNILTLLAAGHETTAKALTWTLYLLALAPAWQDAVREEAFRVAGREPIGTQHLRDLTLAHQVFKEAMRLYPPAPSIARTFVNPATIGGIEFEPGDLAIVPIFHIHRHRSLWDDPDRFDPSRFTPEREKTYPRTQYMPFGAGPRICMGGAFAMAEGVTILAEIIRAARFECMGQQLPEPISRVTLRPRGTLTLHVGML
jgi:cytochrome P450